MVLAGGAGSRLGGAKGGVTLCGRTLAAWVADALGEVAGEVVVAVKEGAAVPDVADARVAVWREPAEPVHPLAGIAWALSRAGDADVFVAAVDLPFCADAVRALAERAAGPAAAAPAVVAEGQPLLGVYRASVAPVLWDAVESGRAARAAVEGLGAVHLAVPDAERTLFNVNTPEDLARAEALAGGGRGSVA